MKQKTDVGGGDYYLLVLLEYLNLERCILLVVSFWVLPF